MGVEQNLNLAEAFVEAHNARDWERLGATLGESVVLYDPFFPEPIRGREGVVGTFQAATDRFPMGQIETVQRFGQGDWVRVETMEGGWDEESEKLYRTEACYILRVDKGKLAEVRFYYDAYGLLLQVTGFPVVATEEE
ncbi:MAG: nuclear transport factor 2 family protein [Thermoplasmata archaeon]